jgi:ribA/ribD-fused uncharacterized protein
MKVTDKYVFFWGEWLSNFYPCSIQYDSKEFKSSEQLFMYLKALFFKDLETAELILKTNTPKEAKKLGRKIKNFDDEAWSKVREDIMFEVVEKKFVQNPNLLMKLMDSSLNNKIFVEASPFDRIWGIGFDEDHAIQNEVNWGENLLGKVITSLRNML